MPVFAAGPSGAPCDNARLDYEAAGFNAFVSIGAAGPLTKSSTPRLVDWGDGTPPTQSVCAGSFGGGINVVTAEEELFAHKYAEPGAYDVHLTAEAANCTGTLHAPVGTAASLAFIAAKSGGCRLGTAGQAAAPSAAATQSSPSSTGVALEADDPALLLPANSPIRQAREKGIPWWQIALAAGLTVAVLMTLVWLQIESGNAAGAALRTAQARVASFFGMRTATASAEAAGATVTSATGKSFVTSTLAGADAGESQVAIKASANEIKEAMAKHFPGGSEVRGKSVFNAGETIEDLLEQANRYKVAFSQPAKKSMNLVRVIDAGRVVGTDATTGAPTNIYSVVTDQAGNLITIHPGVLK